MRRLVGYLVISFVWAWSLGSPAQADQCLRDAKSTFGQCKNACKTDLLDAKAGCLNVTPGCFLACKDGKDECIADAEQPLTNCVAVCDAPLDQARANCKSQCGCGDPGNRCGFNSCYVACVDPFEGDAFTCRDGCRDSFKLDTNAQATLAACKTGFHSCLGTCPAP